MKPYYLIPRKFMIYQTHYCPGDQIIEGFCTTCESFILPYDKWSMFLEFIKEINNE